MNRRYGLRSEHRFEQFDQAVFNPGASPRLGLRARRGLTSRFLGFAGLAAVATSIIACGLDRKGLGGNILSEWGGVFDVRPLYICEGDPVHVSWELVADETVRLHAPCDVRILGKCIIGGGLAGRDEFTHRLPVEVYPTARPLGLLPGEGEETLFVGTNAVDPHDNPASRTVYPTEDTTFSFTALIEGYGRTIPVSHDVRVLRSDEAPLVRTERFEWSCEIGGAWPGIIYERGQLASPNMSIIQVRNISGQAIRLTVKRDRDDEMLPPLIVTEDLEPGDISLGFNGEYYGVWTAVPLTADDVRVAMCDSSESESSLDALPDGVPGERQTELLVEVTFGCGMFIPDDSETPAGDDGAEASDAGGGSMVGTNGTIVDSNGMMDGSDDPMNGGGGFPPGGDADANQSANSPAFDAPDINLKSPIMDESGWPDKAAAGQTTINK